MRLVQSAPESIIVIHVQKQRKRVAINIWKTTFASKLTNYDLVSTIS